MKLRSLLSAAFLVLLLTSPAQAATIDLVLTVNILEPTVGPPEVFFGYSFFESATYGWPGALVNGWPAGASVPSLASGNATLLPGVSEFNVSLDVDSLDNVYFIGSGLYFNAPGQIFPPMSVYIAEPPTGNVSDQTAWAYGPPWISLADLAGGISGNFDYINGYPRGVGIGTYQVTAVNDPAPVPEPASLLLLGSGLAAVAARKYRQSKAGKAARFSTMS